MIYILIAPLNLISKLIWQGGVDILRKKLTIQKSIRFDAKLVEDLEFLSKELERTQNELVNIAVENLMRDNSGYFSKLIIVDNLYEFFNNEKSETFEIQNLTVKVDLDEKGEKYSLYTKVVDGDGIILDEGTSLYSNIDEVQYQLEQLALRHVKYDSDEMRNYLKQRLDYK